MNCQSRNHNSLYIIYLGNICSSSRELPFGFRWVVSHDVEVSSSVAPKGGVRKGFMDVLLRMK